MYVSNTSFYVWTEKYLIKIKFLCLNRKLFVGTQDRFLEQNIIYNWKYIFAIINMTWNLITSIIIFDWSFMISNVNFSLLIKSVPITTNLKNILYMNILQFILNKLTILQINIWSRIYEYYVSKLPPSFSSKKISN